MHRRHLAPFVFAGLVNVAGATGCTALVKFDDPPADGGLGPSDDDVDEPDAADQDVTTTPPDAAVDAGADAADATTPPDASDAGDGATDAAADSSDGGNLLDTCPTACDGYTTGDFWVCGWKRAACIDDQADLNIVDCNFTEAVSAYTCPTGHTCLGSANEDFCDPCQGDSFATICDTSVNDPSHAAYLVTCNGAGAPTYFTCADTACGNCSGTMKTTTPP